MKALLTLLMVPALIVLCIFLSSRLYVNGQYVGAYSLVLTWFATIVLWVRAAGTLLQNRQA
jgi:hypothetical protein